MKRTDYIEDVQEWREAFKFFIPIRIRFSETDMFGHMNNVSPFIYFEQARIDFFSHIGFPDISETQRDHPVPIVGDLQCDYHRELYFNENIHVYVKANHIGNTSVDLHYMATDRAEDICLTGRGRLVYIDASKGQPTPLTADMKEKFRYEGQN